MMSVNSYLNSFSNWWYSSSETVSELKNDTHSDNISEHGEILDDKLLGHEVLAFCSLQDKYA